MLITDSLFVLIALAFAIAYLVQKRKYGTIRATPTFSVEQLQALADDLARRGESGSLRFLTEVKGRVGCDSPLISESTETECVYYRMKVEWEYLNFARRVSILLSRMILKSDHSRTTKLRLSRGWNTALLGLHNNKS